MPSTFSKPLFFAVALLPLLLQAQVKIYQRDTSIKVIANGKQQPLAWCGGFNNPQFSMADLNRDGLRDLVVFEPSLGIRTFINKGVAGSPKYRFAPEYALNFPPVSNYLILADYNCDGIADLFHRGNSGFSAYKGYYNSANQLCFSYYNDLFYSNDLLAGGIANAYNNIGDIPSIVDVDNDGDLDFVSYDISGGTMNFFKNLRVEMSLSCDSIHIALKDRCWGKVYQGFYRNHRLAYSCSNAGLLRGTGEAERTTHSGNTPCLFDWDMDGDYDYLDGSISYNEMTFLKNGKIEFGSAIDTMVEQDTLWQTGGKQISIPIWPSAFNIDVDQDGKKDLLISPNGANASENYKCIWYYKNFSSAGVPDWRFQSDSFLIDETIDVGTASYPVLFDYNKDGMPDLFVGSDGYRQTDGTLKSRLSYYKNIGAPGNPILNLESSDFKGWSSQNYKGAALAIGDIDNDTKSDMLIGHNDGTISYYKNQAASETVTPDWVLVATSLTDYLGNTIMVTGTAAPFIYDIDRDGKKDLVIGEFFGYLYFYRNISTTPGNIRLELITTKLGGVRADARQNYNNYSTPFFGRIDSTGIDYLLVGSSSGLIYRYTGFQTGDTTAAYVLIDSQYSYIDTTHLFYNYPGGALGAYRNKRSTIAVGDIGNDGSYEMIVGNMKGGLELYKWKVRSVLGYADAEENGSIKVYPNPARDVVEVTWNGMQHAQVLVHIMNMAGQRVYIQDVPSAYYHVRVPIDQLPPGVYVCTVQSGPNKYFSKFVIER